MPRIFQNIRRNTPCHFPTCPNRKCNSGNQKCLPNKKMDFMQWKNNTLCSLYEVEHFLCLTGKMMDFLHFYKKWR